MTHLYLASQSPRRRELLQQIGVFFTPINISIIESQQANESPSGYVQRLAVERSFAGKKHYFDKPVLGADTIVLLDDQVLEKPKDKQHALGNTAAS